MTLDNNFDFSRWPKGAMTIFPGDRLRIEFLKSSRPELGPGNAIEGYAIDVDRGGLFRFIPDRPDGAPLLFHVTDDFVRITKLTDWAAIAADVRTARLAECKHEPDDPECTCGDD